MREFSKVGCTISQSRKLRSLDHHKRWAYMCALASPLAHLCGVFRYPLALWADDATLPIPELGQAIESMVDVGLIEWNSETQTVHIIGWWRFNVPKNADHAVSVIKAIEELEKTPFQARCLAGFVFALWPKMQTWKEASSDKVSAFLPYAVETVCFENSIALEQEVLKEVTSAKGWVVNDLASFFPVLADHVVTTALTPSSHRGRTVPPQGEREKEKEKKEIKSASVPLKGPRPETLALLNGGVK